MWLTRESGRVPACYCSSFAEGIEASELRKGYFVILDYEVWTVFGTAVTIARLDAKVFRVATRWWVCAEHRRVLDEKSIRLAFVCAASMHVRELSCTEVCCSGVRSGEHDEVNRSDFVSPTAGYNCWWLWRKDHWFKGVVDAVDGMADRMRRSYPSRRWLHCRACENRRGVRGVAEPVAALEEDG